MQIGKKAALMAAAAGAMVIGTAGAASAYGIGSLVGPGGGVQSTSCDTTTGTTPITGGLAPTGDVSIGSDCVNFTNSGAVYQGNDCDTATGTTAITGVGSTTGDVKVGSSCTNVALQPTSSPNGKSKAKKSKKSHRHSY